MKKATLSISGDDLSVGPFTRVKFALCGAPVKGVSKIATEFHGCREGFVTSVAEHFCNSIYVAKKKSRGKIDTNKVRLCVYRRVGSAESKTVRELENRMKAALRVLNILERKAGWSISRASAAATKHSGVHQFYIFTGSPRWMKSPHFLSMYCLIIRVVANGRFNKVKTYKQLMDTCRKVCDSRSGASDKGHLRVTHDKWLMLMKNYKTLFRNKMMKKCFNPKTFGQELAGNVYAISGEGVSRLCGGKSRDKVLDKRFKSLCKENKLKIHPYRDY